MKIVIAPDSFKESLDAQEVCRSIAKGIKKVFPKAEILLVPMADGGEGTIAAVIKRIGGKTKSCTAMAPLGNKVKALYGLVNGGRIGIVEMAQASGLTLVPVKKRDPMVTTSFGTGEMILSALNHNCKEIILTLGGVGTNDAGVGMAKALGYRFLDKNRAEIPEGAAGLLLLAQIDKSHVHPKIGKTKFVAAYDVKNPLCGSTGSAVVYGPQKGATPKMIQKIDSALRNFSQVVEKDLKIKVSNLAGAGSAGGAGAGSVAFLNAELKSGIDWVIESTQLEKKIQDADLVITGEGKIDEQTIFGKVMVGVAKIAKRYGIPTIAFCGRVGDGAKKVHSLGIDAFFSIANGPISHQESLKNAGKLLTQTTEEVMRLSKHKLH